MSDTTPNRRLIEEWRAGNQDAARKLFDLFGERLLTLARRRLSQRLASRVDPEDIVQSVFRTFFGRVRAGEFTFDDPDDLCKLLMRITIHKTLRQIAYHKAAKRDPSHETGQSEHSHEMLMELLDREPTADDAVAFLDQVEHFFAGLPELDRQIVELRLQGFSNEEIAAKLNIYDRKIRRIVERLRGIAEQEGIAPSKDTAEETDDAEEK